jgi:mycothiol synthase
MTADLAGYDLRPHTADDVDAVTELIAAVESSVLGEELITRADIAASWSVDTFDHGRHSLGIYQDGQLVAAAEIYDRSVDVHVHPDATGRGLGTYLRHWTEQRARELGREKIGQIVPDQNPAAGRILRDAGYMVGHTSWILQIEHPVRPDDPRPPAGVQIRHYRPEDAPQAYQVIEDAFSEWNGRIATTYEQWRALTVDREDFVAEDFLLAERDGRIVGAAFVMDDRGEMWVDKLAVQREHRDQGIARALLQETFQRSYDRGNRISGLATDSRTGALTLYEKIGMVVSMSFTRFELAL